jgi:ABC-2 type transport system permease protein
MNWRIIKALVSKDFSLFFRNRFFAIVTVIGIIFYLSVYFWMMPKSVNESLEIGLYAPVSVSIFSKMEGEGLEIQEVDSEEALKEAVVDGKYVAGISLPGDTMEKLLSGQKPSISVYFASDVPEETKDAIIALIQEAAYQLSGQPMTVEISEEILGSDMMGMQIPPRDRIRPLLAVMLLIFETYGLANLIAEEVERHTIQALLVTPVTVSGFFISKGITGVSLAFIQAALFMAIVGGMNHKPLIIITTLLLGAIMVTGIGFIIASLSRDFMSVLAWGMVALIPLFIPSFGVMFPGAVTGWIKFIPSYYLVDTVHRTADFGAGWSDVWLNLLILIGCDFILGWIGVMVLGRRTR